MLGVGRPSPRQGVHDCYMFTRIVKSLIPKRSRFRGHVDSICDGYIFGWLFDAKNPERSLVFDLFVNGDYHGQWTCAYFRPDLLAGNLGNGAHGFKVPLGRMTAESIDSLELFLPAVGAKWLAACDGKLLPLKGAGATRALRLKRFRDRLIRSEATVPSATEGPGASWIAGLLSRCDVYRAQRRSGLQSSDFTEFLRRLKGLGGDDVEFYSWYVNDYLYKLDPRFIPLSEDEKNFIRALIESTRSEINSPPFSFFLRLLSWKSYRGIREAYKHYWWSAEGGRQLNLHLSIPRPNESQILQEFVRYGFGRSFPLTYFMAIFALSNHLVNPIVMLFPFGRRQVYEWCYHYGYQNSHIRRRIKHVLAACPSEARSRLGAKSFQYCCAASNQHQEIEKSVSPPVYSSQEMLAKKSDVSLQFIGPFDKLLGLGESSRRLMEAVRVVEKNCAFVCYNDGIQSASMEGEYNYDLNKSKLNIIHLNLEQIPEFVLSYGDLFQNSYNIVFPYWELSKLSSLHLLGLKLIDEVWSASTFINSLFHGKDLPVTTIGVPASILGDARADAYSRSDRFTFLTTFDAYSWPQRKNAIGVVEAFLAGFSADIEVRLIVKTQNAKNVHSIHQKRAWEMLIARCGEDERIEVIDETYSPSQQRDLISSCDCLVSLHRAEGLGIDLLDALASGVPVIATAYSGNMDLCAPNNTWLVDYDLISVREDEYVFVEDSQLWANPKTDSAVQAMRGVYYEHQQRYEKSSAGIADAHRLRSRGAIAQKIRHRLAIIRSSKGS